MNDFTVDSWEDDEDTTYVAEYENYTANKVLRTENNTIKIMFSSTSRSVSIPFKPKADPTYSAIIFRSLTVPTPLHNHY